MSLGTEEGVKGEPPHMETVPPLFSVCPEDVEGDDEFDQVFPDGFQFFLKEVWEFRVR